MKKEQQGTSNFADVAMISTIVFVILFLLTTLPLANRIDKLEQTIRELEHNVYLNNIDLEQD